jgi:hypothetical protein
MHAATACSMSVIRCHSSHGSIDRRRGSYLEERTGFGEVKTTTIAKYASCNRQIPSVVVYRRMPSVDASSERESRIHPRLQVYFSADRSMLITHTKPVRRQGISRAIERWTNNLGHIIQTRNHPLETSFHHRHRRIQKYLAKSKIQNACLASSSRDDHGTNDAGWRTGIVARCTQTVPSLESITLAFMENWSTTRLILVLRKRMSP